MGSARAQRVSISAKGLPLQKVLTEISKQAKHILIYDEKDLKDSKVVTTRFTDKPMTEALDIVLEGQRVRYTIKGRSIVISRFSKEAKESSRKIPSISEQQDAIRGRVTDSAGNALAGVTVQVKGKNIRTLTNAKGEYEFATMDNNAILVFSSIGYVPVELGTSGRSTLNISLNATNSRIEEVFVERGYYKVSKKLNTGAVSSINAKEIAAQPVSNPILALQGRIPGMYIAQESGVPGSKLNVRLRGRNSIANGNDPLYIVDGVPFPSTSLAATTHASAAFLMSPLASIGMDNIESIDVLKDADATAIYGSRGANGVVIITTKKGKAGKTSIDANISRGFGETASKLKLLTTREYLEMRREAFKNDDVEIGATDYDLNGAWGDTNQYTDWQDVLIGNTADLTDARLNISGGNAQTQFLIGGSWRKETTVFPGDFMDAKSGAHFNINHRTENNRFQVSLSASYLKEMNKLPTTDFTERIALAPNTPNIYNADGSLNWQNSTWQNPFGNLRQTSKANVGNLNSTLNLSFKIVKNLNLKSRFGYNELNWKGVGLIPFSSFNPAFSNPEGLRENRLGTTKNQSWIIEPTLDYSKDLGWGKFESMIGMTFQGTERDMFAQTASGFSSDAIIENVKAATTIRVNNAEQTKYRYNAIYGRIGFTHKDRYSINITARRDGSSRFSPGRQFGNFAAVGSAWIFSEEVFVADHLPFLSFGKLRGSYGITGNDQTGDYQYLSRYNPTSTQYQGTVGFTPVSHTSVDYGWENVRKIEGALELGFIENRLMLQVSAYRNRTSNQLVGYPLPSYTGFATVTANLPAVIQNTGSEIEASADIIRNDRFKWSTTANISFPKNKLLSYPNFEKSTYARSLIIGEPLFLRRLYDYKGINPETGLYTFTDFNNDEIVTYDGDTRPMFNGQKYFGGINNSFSFGRFQFDIFVQFVKQKGYRYDSSSLPGVLDTYSNITQHVFQNRSTDKNIGFYQPFTQNWDSAIATETYNYWLSNGMIVDASFVRLKNISFSYQLPKGTADYLRLKNARFYAQAQNMLTLTNFAGADPENSDTANLLRLPPLRIFTFGIQFTL
ncbi:SusC/RagA family TonB-linked outer membrane protein [Sphingobacterium siyangense]|uniref:SusC/RagA family TonB-linked outer membrane protein n=1 Tax=Sphingobacterium siyangense TaxID=459529 RepID=UPI001966B808|nr:SusC/RagA family TonB-linked outer membrane protein [Sphingobacterium siyangense]QRY55566.1 SusC/RagA family TonB-linked outer membrane protein [Sphingobacterium siyangense]